MTIVASSHRFVWRDYGMQHFFDTPQNLAPFMATGSDGLGQGGEARLRLSQEEIAAAAETTAPRPASWSGGSRPQGASPDASPHCPGPRC